MDKNSDQKKFSIVDVLFNISTLPPELKNEYNYHFLCSVIEPYLHRNYYSKNQLLFTPGKVSDNIYFLERGTVIGFIRDETAKENVLFLWDERSVITDCKGFFFSKPSDFYALVNEDSIVIELLKSDFEKIALECPFLKSILNAILEDYYCSLLKSNLSFTSISPIERLGQFIEDNPKAFSRYSQSAIASHLGISRQTINRYHHQ